VIFVFFVVKTHIMIPFQLKKFISQFLMPMPLVCECFLLGWVLTRFTKYKKTGKCFSFLALFLFLLFGYGFGRTYLYNLERRYPPFDPTPEQCEALRGAPVVVLGQGMAIKSDLPLRYQNNPVFERRLFEGVRVAKLIPESRLIVSMAGEASNSVKQAFLDGYMLQVNFPTNRVFMFTTARDTSEEASCAKLLIEKCANAKMRECANGTSNQVPSFKGLSAVGIAKVDQVSNLSTNAFEHSRTRALSSSSEFTNSSTRALPTQAPIPEFAHSSTRAFLSTPPIPAFTNSRIRAFLSTPPIPAFAHSSTRAFLSTPPIPEFEHSSIRALILATSASHIPRAMKIFQKQGLNPIAAPCDYTDSKEPKLNWENWYQWPLPNGKNIDHSERALYEWLGNVFERIF
jgi:uncharacterized SAM-binding protein YcdF (DUF218 family)